MDTTGVVGELRIPDPVRRAYPSTPGLAVVFIGLSVLDAVARTLGLLQPPVRLDLAQPLTVLGSFLPRDLLIVLPAVILIRLPSALVVTPFALAGAMAISLGQLLELPLGSVALPSIMGYSAATFLPALGWISLGWGLALLNPKTPPPTVAGTANLVAAVVVIAAAVLGFLPLVIPRELDLRDPSIINTVVSIAIVQILGALAWGFFLRAVVRGFGDPRRPNLATSIGTFAALLAGALGLAIAVLTVVGRIDSGLLAPIVQSPIYVPMFWLAGGGATSLLVVAFGLGLADPLSRVGGMVLD
jgi:hypothetical protein